MPLSTIFQLYHGGQFYWWRKPENPEKTTKTGGIIYDYSMYSMVNIGFLARKMASLNTGTDERCLFFQNNHATGSNLTIRNLYFFINKSYKYSNYGGSNSKGQLMRNAFKFSIVLFEISQLKGFLESLNGQ